MSPNDVYVLTEKGLEEIRTKKDRLAPELRILFFMLDGRATSGEVIDQLGGFGVKAEIFDQLHSSGYIALQRPTPSAPAAPGPAAKDERPAPVPYAGTSEDDRFFLARQFMNETVVNAVGIRGFFFTLKLEKSCTLLELRNLLPDYQKLLLKGQGSLEAEVLLRRARELTNPKPPR